ncbi:MAG: aminotransferase class I/II-fold pyridoxal phosphate-dependent enzyme [bacterium]|nr:aminotransferase class I/II-fold pyridoxal phosphate-dependent enzyme [bacterium]
MSSSPYHPHTVAPRVTRISHVVENLPPSGIRAFFDLVMSMDDVISLGVGEPDFVTPWRIREASIFAIEKGYTSYTSNRGMPELLREISSWLARSYDLHYNPSQHIIITVGVSEALDLAMRAIINPGDEVIVPEPAYVSYAPTVALAGGIPVSLPTWHVPGFKITPDALDQRISSRTRAVVINYPANPTGTSYSRAELEALAAVIRKHDLLLLSDEVYDQLSYDAPHIPIATLPGMYDRTLYFNGFSKAYAMTGYRLGFACGPEPIISAMIKIHQYTMLCAPIISQMAAIEALRNATPDVREMVAEYNRRRRFIVHALNLAGLPCHLPEGAFYAFPSIAPTGMDGVTFATRLLQEERVAVVPGTAFGPGGSSFIRIAYAASFDNLREAARRITRFVARHAPHAVSPSTALAS